MIHLVCAGMCAYGAYNEWRKHQSPGWFAFFVVAALGNLAFWVTA